MGVTHRKIAPEVGAGVADTRPGTMARAIRQGLNIIFASSFCHLLLGILKEIAIALYSYRFEDIYHR